MNNKYYRRLLHLERYGTMSPAFTTPSRAKPPYRRNRALLNRLWLAQEGRCYYCTRLMLGKTESEPDFPTWEHKTPTSRGGEDNLSNLVIACVACNQDKSDMTEDEYLKKRYLEFITDLLD